MQTRSIKNTIFVLYVKDQKLSKEFYSKVLQLDPVLDVPGMTEFQLCDQSSLGLMPSAGIVKILEGKIVDPELANGIPRSELYLRVENPQEFHERAIAGDGKEIQPLKVMNWGDKVAYSTDPDGHIIAFATSSACT